MATPTRPALRSRAPQGSPARRRQRRAQSRRLVPLVLAALVAFAVGAALGGARDDPRRAVAAKFVEDWENGDFAEMRALTTPESQRRYSLKRFAAAYRRAAKIATVSRVTPGRAGDVQDG